MAGAANGSNPKRAEHAAAALAELEGETIACERCPRLVAWRQNVARPGYWAQPVPSFGDPAARLYILGLATAAHGGNRTGRAFTGNATADWLVAALHQHGLANQATSVDASDGLLLRGVRVGSAVRCAPPQNRPTAGEQRACADFLRRELALLPELRVVLALGRLAWTVAARVLDVRPRPRFAHGAEVSGPITLIGSYHPSRRNTQTGLLTREMLDEVVGRAVGATTDREAASCRRGRLGFIES